MFLVSYVLYKQHGRNIPACIMKLANAMISESYMFILLIFHSGSKSVMRD